MSASLLVAASPATAAANDLFFSEYIEGSSNNKAIEIYNGTGAAVDLDGYSVELYSNGSSSAGNTLDLTGTLADGDVYVIGNASAVAGIADVADVTSTVTFFNGDDALVLKSDGAIIDSFGQVGVDPGAEWTGGGQEDTLRRMADVCSGDANATDAFDAAVEWTASGQDDFSGLGSHTANCGGGPAPDVAPTVSQVDPADGAVGVVADVAPVVTFSEPVTVEDGTFRLKCDDTPLTVEVTGDGAIYTVTPDQPLAEAAQCELTVTASTVTDLDGESQDAMEADFTSTFTVSEGLVAIGAVQGSTDESPYAGQVVTVEGIVVGDYEGESSAGALRGFYVQSADAEGDGDPATSEGIFVFNAGADEVSLGDRVSITGQVAEYQGQTQISFADVSVLSGGHTVAPTEVHLPFATAQEAERYEGMLTTFPQTLTVTEIYRLGRFNEVTVSGEGKLDQPTAVVAPGSAANALQAANGLNAIKVDDAVNLSNADPMGRGGDPLTAGNTLRGGDTVVDLTGVMTYTWSGDSSSGNAWRVRPVSMDAPTPDFQATNPRPLEAPEVGGDVTVASFNVLNYFRTLDTGAKICGPAGNMEECRGAESALELERQTDKLVEALAALDADVIGIMEMENTTGVEPLATLADLLDERTGVDAWEYVDTGVVGTDVIRVGMLYNSDVVTEAGSIAVLDGTVDERFDDSRNRPSVAQTFEETASGETFTVVTNHWKSKGSCPSSGADADQGDGASCWNESRTDAATALVDWLDGYPTGVEDDDTLIIGDLNSYAMEDPIQVLRDAGYVELGDDYSYVFDGQWGSLDYVFASQSMEKQVTDAAHFHINSDEPGVLDYNTNFKSDDQIADLYAADMYRTSDHDPLVAGLDLSGDMPETTTVQLLATNDFHGRILPNFDSGEAGAAVMAGAVKQLRAPYANSIFAAAGDLIGASSFESSVAQDKPTIDALNAMGLDVSAVGNHEFDQGYDDLIGRVMAEGDEAGGATWKYLGANVRFEDDGTAALPETWLATFDNGTVDTADDVSIGFVGVVTDSTPSLVSPGGIEGLEFEKEAVAANRSAAVLESEGADAIVLLVHEGAPTSEYADAVDTNNDFGEMLADLDDSIDAVVSGHTHMLYDHEVPVASWESRDFGRPVVSAGQYGMYLNELMFEFDPTSGELVDIGSDVIDLAETTQVDPGCVGTTEAPCETTPVFPADPEVQASVDAAVDASEELGARTIGEITEPLYRARLAGGSAGGTRGAESTLGNAIADVHLWATKDNGAQIAFMNPGGLRADLLGAAAGAAGQYPSEVSYRQAYSVQPFGNTLTTMTLTGAQIASVLEEQWQPAGESRPFLRLGVSEGFEYTFDADAEPGSRILQMWLDDERIEPEAEYTVAMNSFLADGGDNFSTFAEGTDVADTARVDSDVMVEYFASNDTLGTAYDQRAIGLNIDSFEVAAGDDLSFDLSSLMFTAPTDLVDTSVTVSLERGALDTFPVTNTLPTTVFDDHGTATVTVTIPAGVSGDVTLWVEGDTTGTRFPIAITVAGDGFRDTAGSEHAEAIAWFANQGITHGWSDGTFRPLDPATRDAVAAFLYRLAGSPEVTGTVPEFSDVDDSMEHNVAMRWLASERISRGWSDGTFRPYSEVTRDAFAAFLYRMAGEPEFDAPAEPTFSDIDPSMEHYDAIEWAAAQGITMGWSDGTYRPYDSISRDAIAAFLYRYDSQF